MRIEFNTNLNFKRRLRSNEEAEFSAVLKQGKEKVGNTGHSILIVPSASLPQEINTGVGNFLDKEAQKFIDFAKQYWGINYIQLLPDGKYRVSNYDNFLPYSGSSLDLGEHIINAELLTTEEFGKILTKDDIIKIADSNNIKDTRINFENVLNKNSATDKTLRKAYNELLKGDTAQKKNLLQKLENYSQINREWLEPKAIFEALSTKYNSRDTRCWNEFDHNLYNLDVVSLDKRNSAINGIMNCELGNEARFFKFKQFLADTHLSLAKEKLNQKGIKLSGDMLAGFSFDEAWANPKAFIKNSTIGWGLPAINLDSKDGEEMLRKKVNRFAQRYDGLRLDASWTYVEQPIKDNATGNKTKKIYNSKILEIIEDEIKKVKGKDFNFENVMHEFVTDLENFNIFEGTEIKPLGRDRVKIYTSSDISADWGTTSAFKKRGWKNGSYVLGIANHDSPPLRADFRNNAIRTQQIEVLSNILKIPKEKLNNIHGFIQARFAEPMRSKHNMFFFTEALNIIDKYKDNINNGDDYRVKIPKNYQDEYFRALENGEGLNIMDALEKAFIADGLDKKEPELYKKIVKYKKILKAPEKSDKKRKVFVALFVAKLALTITYLIYRKYKKKAGETGSCAQ